VEAFKHWRHYIKGLLSHLEVLSDHNNLKGFIKVKALNRRQARWAIALAAYNFIIKHRAGKTNPADTPSRQPLGAGGPPEEDTTLPLLQRTLGIQGHQPKVNVPLGVHESKPSAEVPLLQLQAGDPTEVRLDNIALQFNWATCTHAVEQHMTKTQVREASAQKSAYKSSTETVVKLIKRLQATNNFVLQKRSNSLNTARHHQRTRSKPVWQFNSTKLLCHRGRLYMPPDPAVHAELLQIHHNDALAGHFSEKKTLDLLLRKYY